MYLSKDRMIDSISEQLINLSKFVLIKNALGLTDINKGAEDFFCHLLNMIYGLSLANMNESISNYPAIDLADKNSRVCIQVTSENSKRKITNTIEKFKSHNLDQDFDWLVFLIISDKNKPQIECDEKFGVDVIDTKRLIQKINCINDINIIDQINTYIIQNLISSSPANNSILPTNIMANTTVSSYELFLNLFKLSPNDEHDNEFKRLLVSALNDLQGILLNLSQQEREYIYLVVAKGAFPTDSSISYNETIIIPASKLDIILSHQTAYELYQSLSSSNIVHYLDEYQPYYDSPYVPSIEVCFSGECEINLFVELKKFTNNNDNLLRQIVIECNFSVLGI